MNTVDAYPKVEDLLFHEHPMVLVDKLVSLQENSATIEVYITPEKLFIKNGKIPAYVGIEYMAQSIGVFAGAGNFKKGKPPGIGFLLGSHQIDQYCDFYSVGQVLQVFIKKIWDGEELIQFECSIVDKKTTQLLMCGNINVYSPSRKL